MECRFLHTCALYLFKLFIPPFVKYYVSMVVMYRVVITPSATKRMHPRYSPHQVMQMMAITMA